MAFVHGKNTKVTLNAVDLSTFIKKTDNKNSADTHDVTTYGPSRESKSWAGGLKDGTVTHEGVYDNSATGPRATFMAILGDTVTWVFQPEGTGAGKAQTTGSVVVKAYNESDPVDDMVTWVAELQMTGEMNHANQS